MPRVRRPPGPSPLNEPRPPDPVAVVSVRSLPTDLRARGKWVDEAFGNRDGNLSAREVAAYERAYGGDAGHAHTIAGLKRQLELGTPVGSVTTTPVDASALAIATRLVRAGGSGTAEDARVLATEVARLPAELLLRLERADVKVVACRGSITDHLTNLRNVQPRGWPPGATWDTVPGVFNPGHGEVVIATVDGPNGERLVPDHGQGHGSFNAVFHEVGHAIDGLNVLGRDSESADFRAAYAADRGALVTNHEDYLLQPGDAGPQEAYAEVGARFFGHDAALATTYPNLEAFFAGVGRDVGIPR